MPKSIAHHKSVLLIVVLASFSSLALAEVPNSFTAGQPAVAKQINDNFIDLDERIIELGDKVADQSNGINQEVGVDCDEDSEAFLNTPINSHTTYTLTGMCDGPIWISERNSIHIQGDGDDNDGVVLEAGLADHPYAAIGVWESKEYITGKSDRRRKQLRQQGLCL
ncbi:MAG: hypothetical protein GY875_03410 [Gammaproteobacteria bacterium]|nr:hypothetical protein [Gammaproteobacteria bacterium]